MRIENVQEVGLSGYYIFVEIDNGDNNIIIYLDPDKVTIEIISPDVIEVLDN